MICLPTLPAITAKLSSALEECHQQTLLVFQPPAVHQLYSIPVSGGSPTMELTTAAMEARISPDGKSIVYMDNKSYEDGLRKHDVSAFARDIWRYDSKSGKHTKLTSFVGGDSTPVWSADGSTVYFLSEQSDSNFNVWKMDAKGGALQQVSDHKTHPVRSLSVSDEGKLAYSWHGNLYTQVAGGQPQKLDVALTSVKQNLSEKSVNIAGQGESLCGIAKWKRGCLYCSW